MIGNWVLKWTSFLLAIVVSSPALAQRPTDYLIVENHSAGPIWVSIRPHGNAPWDQEVMIDGTANAPLGTVPASSIALHDGEPFDISIRQSDGQIFLAKRIELCTFMRKCENGGKAIWKVPGRLGAWINHRYVEHSGDLEMKGQADRNRFTLPYFQFVRMPDPRPFPQPEPK